MRSPLPWLLAGILLLTADPARAVPPGGSFESFDRQARLGARLKVVFFGGPFTDGVGLVDIDKDSWRERFQQFLVARYPRAAFHFDLVSMGDTGSKRAMFHTRDLIDGMKPDLVFVDFLIEDGIQGENRDALAAYESILRDLAYAGVPIMQVFTGISAVQGKFWKPVLPQRLRDYLEFVTLYRTGVGESHHGLHQVLASRQYTMDDIWPHNAMYPAAIGHDLIFASLRDGFLEAVAQKRVGMYPYQPAFSWLYNSRQKINLAEFPLPDGWIRSPASLPLAVISGAPDGGDLVMWASGGEQTIRPLRLDFSGTLVAIYGEATSDSLEFKATIDGKTVSPPASPDKKTRSHWALPKPKADSEQTAFWIELTSRLSSGPHSLELTPVVDDSGRLGQLRIRSIFIAGE
ncbi:MAG: hypothetical protein H7X97_04190 [Opitutaceae bacterium]|nr:hypothetical protein [Verrucomicrobiales bacterium]